MLSKGSRHRNHAASIDRGLCAFNRPGELALATPRRPSVQPYRQFGETLILPCANECRERAEEILTKAETFHHADAKQKLLEIAAQYLDLAMGLENAARDQTRSAAHSQSNLAEGSL
jgi:hypothetical protein